MKIIMEVFYLRIVDDVVLYRRKQVNLSNKQRDPDGLIGSLIRQDPQTPSGDEFLVHSTSWRYMPPGKVMLTYVAYSDELEFGRAKPGSLTLKQLRKINLSSSRPRSRAGLEKQVVAHAMRHIAFLIKTDYGKAFKHAFTPKTRKIFRSLWVDLAGRVF